MLFETETIRRLLDGINVQGVLHIGAHECEELAFYRDALGIPMENIHWVEAIPSKVDEARRRGIPNVHQAVITDRHGLRLPFHIANNGQSSSLLDLKTHAIEHPDVYYVDHFITESTTIDTLLESHGIDVHPLNLWNIDIQGNELMALQGGKRSLAHADALYLEVNEKELYSGCALVHDLDAFLGEQGFDRVATQMTRHGWGDALYRRRMKAIFS